MYFRSRSRKKLPKESRTIPLKGHPVRGNGEDDGKLFRCWNCGFVCDKNREALSGPEGGDGLTYEDFHLPSYGVKDTNPYNSSSVSVMRGNGEQVCVGMRLVVNTPSGEGDDDVLMGLNRIDFGGQGIDMGSESTAYNEEVGQINHHVMPVVNSGCPFCGSKNWHGDH